MGLNRSYTGSNFLYLLIYRLRLGMSVFGNPGGQIRARVRRLKRWFRGY